MFHKCIKPDVTSYTAAALAAGGRVPPAKPAGGSGAGAPACGAVAAAVRVETGSTAVALLAVVDPTVAAGGHRRQAIHQAKPFTMQLRTPQVQALFGEK